MQFIQKDRHLWISNCGEYAVVDTQDRRLPFRAMYQEELITEPRRHRRAAIADCIRHQDEITVGARRAAATGVPA